MILRALRQLFAPDRYPLPETPIVEFPEKDDSAEVMRAKAVRTGRRAAQLQKAQAWRARVSGFTLAVLVISTLNVALFLMTWLVKPISALQYGLILNIAFPLLSISARRIVRL